MRGELETPGDVIVDRLAVYLGPNTARVALVTFCQAALSMPPSALTRSDVPRVLAALRPMLRTLLGGERSEEVLARIAEDLREPPPAEQAAPAAAAAPEPEADGEAQPAPAAGTRRR